MRLVALIGCAVFCSVTATLSQDRDTIREYDVSLGTKYHRVTNGAAVAARFSLVSDARLIGCQLWLRGPIGASARLRIYGHETGASVPFREADLIDPLRVVKKINGYEQLSVEFDHDILLTGDQFFVCIDSTVGECALLSDCSQANNIECICATETFTRQCIRRSGRQWETALNAFLVEPIVEYVGSDTTVRFVADTLIVGPRKSGDKHAPFLMLGDLDDDGRADIATHRAVFLQSQNGGFDTGATIAGEAQIRRRYVSAVRMRNGRLCLLSPAQLSDGLSVPTHDKSYFTRSITLPETEMVVGTVASDLDCDGNEEVIVGLRQIGQQDSTQQAALQSEAVSHLMVMDCTSERAIVSADIRMPPAFYLQAVNTVDADSDGDLDIICIVTDARGTPFTYSLENRSKEFVASGQPARLGKTSSLMVMPTMDHERSVSKTVNIDAALSRPHALLTHVSKSFSEFRAAWSSQPYDREVELSNEDDYTSVASGEDRLSSVHQVDINSDGMLDIVTATTDRCRLAKIFVSDDRSLKRVRASGIELLSGAGDIAWADLDKDGDLDAVSDLDSIVIILWNHSSRMHNIVATVPALPAGSSRMLVSTQKQGRIFHPTYGRGRNVHERTSESISLSDALDTCTVSTLWPDKQITHRHWRVAEDSGGKLNSQSGCTVTFMPNPFNNSLQISGTITGGDATVTVVDVSGNVVWKGEWSAGTDKLLWQGVTATGEPVAAGIYTVMIHTSECTVQSRIVRLP